MIQSVQALKSTREVMVMNRGRSAPPEIDINKTVLASGDSQGKITKFQALEVLFVLESKHPLEHFLNIKAFMETGL